MNIIGGGATGAGCLLDATTRGLNVALVERDDFASGTSSRSTKLVHGGVRYLEKAFTQLDYGQYELVTEALAERKSFLDIAPHLSNPLPILLPVYKWWQVPYFWIGCKFYDLFAGQKGLSSSYILSASKSIEVFPTVKAENLKAGLVYYDGQQNDSRMNISLALTSAAFGATVVNHCEVKELIKENGQVVGAIVEDSLSGKRKTVRAKSIVNATGPFTDSIRKMDNQEVEPIVIPSAGVHIILPEYFAPENIGLLDPSTSDGRMIFFLPWQGRTIAGTTDAKSEVTYNPYPNEEHIEFILRELNHFLSSNVKINRSDVLAAWSGLRPLVKDPNKLGTENLSRSHVVEVSDSGLISISGGKWTTYRRMAQDTIDKVIEVKKLNVQGPCLTEKVKVIGGFNYDNLYHISLGQKYGLDKKIATHLAHSYGSIAEEILAKNEIIQIHPEFPYIEAEIPYAIHKEYARTLIDFIARRTRLSFLDARACNESIQRIADIMAKELGWNNAKKNEEIIKAKKYLLTMGLADTNTHFDKFEYSKYRNYFSEVDKNHDGKINVEDLISSLSDLSFNNNLDQVREVVSDSEVDFGTFIDIINNYKTNSKFDKKKFLSRQKISTL